MKLHEILLIVWPFSWDPKKTSRKQCGKNQTLNKTKDQELPPNEERYSTWWPNSTNLNGANA